MCGCDGCQGRIYYLSTETDWFADKPLWQKLNAFGMVISEVEREGKVCRETRYYITSLDDINKFSEAVRKHWGIENSLHWCLDMTFHEDYNRSRKGNSAENMAVVRHLALNALKANPEPISLARKNADVPMTIFFLLISFILFMREP